MARTARNAKPVRKHVNLSYATAAKLDLYCIDPVTQKPRRADRNLSSVIELALIEFFDKRKGENDGASE